MQDYETACGRDLQTAAPNLVLPEATFLLSKRGIPLLEFVVSPEVTAVRADLELAVSNRQNYAVVLYGISGSGKTSTLLQSLRATPGVYASFSFTDVQWLNDTIKNERRGADHNERLQRVVDAWLAARLAVALHLRVDARCTASQWLCEQIYGSLSSASSLIAQKVVARGMPHADLHRAIRQMAGEFCALAGIECGRVVVAIDECQQLRDEVNFRVGGSAQSNAGKPNHRVLAIVAYFLAAHREYVAPVYAGTAVTFDVLSGVMSAISKLSDFGDHLPVDVLCPKPQRNPAAFAQLVLRRSVVQRTHDIWPQLAGRGRLVSTFVSFAMHVSARSALGAIRDTWPAFHAWHVGGDTSGLLKILPKPERMTKRADEVRSAMHSSVRAMGSETSLFHIASRYREADSWNPTVRRVVARQCAQTMVEEMSIREGKLEAALDNGLVFVHRVWENGTKFAVACCEPLLLESVQRLSPDVLTRGVDDEFARISDAGNATTAQKKGTLLEELFAYHVVRSRGSTALEWFESLGAPAGWVATNVRVQRLCVRYIIGEKRARLSGAGLADLLRKHDGETFVRCAPGAGIEFAFCVGGVLVVGGFKFYSSDVVPPQRGCRQRAQERPRASTPLRFQGCAK